MLCGKINFKKRFPGFGCKRVKDVAYCEFFQPTKDIGAASQDFKDHLLSFLGCNKTIHCYGFKSKYQAPTMLEIYLKDVCVPEMLLLKLLVCIFFV